MRFTPCDIADTWLIEPEPTADERGFFARIFCEDEFAARGLETRFVQHSLSFSHHRGTLRGMHYQHDPHAEVKIVTCIAGAVWDVLLDLRPQSPSYRRWQGFDLSAANRRRLYVPRGVAHGFQTLQDGTEVQYMISARHAPDAAAGIRHDDPAFGIAWPLPVSVIAAKDRAWPDFRD